MSDSAKKPVVNLDEVEFVRTQAHGDKYAAKLAPISPLLGAQKLGYNLTAVPPGKRAFPYHNHHANEEMVLILEGQGTLRYGKQELPLRKGDIIGCPPGGPEVAHQIINTGDVELRYLAVSTTIDTDVFQYPDSGKFGVVGGRKPGQSLAAAAFPGKFVVEADCVDYWKGE